MDQTTGDEGGHDATGDSGEHRAGKPVACSRHQREQRQSQREREDIHGGDRPEPLVSLQNAGCYRQDDRGAQRAHGESDRGCRLDVEELAQRDHDDESDHDGGSCRNQAPSERRMCERAPTLTVSNGQPARDLARHSQLQGADWQENDGQQT